MKSNERWYAAVQALAVKDGPFDQYKHALKQLLPKVASASGIKNISNAILWKFSKEEVTSILLRIERLKTLVQIALEMDHFELSRAVHSDNQAIKSDTSFVRDAIQQDQTRQRHNMIMDWISPTDFQTQQGDTIARRQEGTGLWFVDSPEFTNWLHESKRTLFCPGIPGAGKTMMAAITVDHLLKTVRSNAIGVSYIYCNYKAQTDQNATTLLAAILKQLVRNRPSTAEPVTRLYDLHATRNTMPSLDEIFSALQSVLTIYSTVYVVIDALDECPDKDGTRSQLLAKLRDLQRKTDLRLMATSRLIPDIVQEFNGMPMLEVRASDADVRQFVTGQIYRLPKCIQRDNELQGSVQDKIVEAVDGMFLLARLHIDSLLDKDTKKVQSTLDKLSGGSKALDEAYDEAIQRIKGQLSGKRARAKSVLSWITYAQRALTTEELRHALAVEQDDEELDCDNIPDIEDIISVCAGLVIVDEESNIIRLVHYTTQEYFERIRENWNPNAQQEIALTCLTYLSFNTFRSGSCPSNGQFERRLEQNVFLDYAARYWGYHAQTVQEDVCELASFFLQHSNLVSCAVQAMSMSEYRYGGYSQTFPKQATGLHLTATFGLLYLLRKLLSRPSGNLSIFTDSRDGDGRTPLSWAAEKGHEAVVKLLVERTDVEADSKDRDGRTPLAWAAEKGYEAVVELLVERADVEADSKDHADRTPLSWAAGNGHEAVVKLLVERADVETDSKDRDGRTPLLWAAEKGHEAVVELLVERADVEADSKDSHGRTPLAWAAGKGHEAVVELLVERADVEADSKDCHGRTPLAWAAGNVHEAVVKLLVERADVEADSKDRDGRTLLLWAAARGHEAVVKLLVERADVEADSKDRKGQTPLLWAAKNGHKAVVKLLVERADVEADSKDHARRTPLSWAAEKGHEAVVKLLVERADVEADSKDCHGRTPLAWAAGKGHEAVVELLVERSDVEADSKDRDSRTSLAWAAVKGHEAAVKLLVERADVEANSKDRDGRTPLLWAAGNGHEAVVKLLVERADVEADSKDRDGRTPLSWAAKNGHEAAVKLLIERAGVEANSKDRNDQTPLLWAVRKGHEAIVKLLVERADVEADSKDRAGQTPLSWAAGKGHEAIVKLLVERADVEADSEDRYGQTPLLWAAKNGHEAVVNPLKSKLPPKPVTLKV